MKMPAAISAVLVAFAAAASAAIKIPKGVLPASQYDDALAQAKQQKKPLALVLLDDAAAGKGAEETAEEVFKSVSSMAVVVFISTARQNEEAYLLPPPFLSALLDSGITHVPALVLAPPSEDIVWKVITPPAKATAKDIRKTFRDGVADVKPTAAAWFAAPPAFQRPDKPLLWALAKEKGYKGKFVKVENEQLFITNEKGETAPGIPFKDLKPATARYAQMLGGDAGGAATAPATADAGKPGPEKWTNAKGVEIEATFVKLTGNSVTLRLANGRDSTLPLSSLSAASQARAKELGAVKK